MAKQGQPDKSKQQRQAQEGAQQQQLLQQQVMQQQMQINQMPMVSFGDESSLVCWSCAVVVLSGKSSSRTGARGLCCSS